MFLFLKKLHRCIAAILKHYEEVIITIARKFHVVFRLFHGSSH